MNLKIILLILSSSASTLAFAAGKSDDPLVTKIAINRLEMRKEGDHTLFFGSMKGWIGKDYNKASFGLKAKKKEEDTSGEAFLRFRRAVSPFWDLALGAKLEFNKDENTPWASFAIIGVLPFFIETEFDLSIREDGLAEIEVEMEQEYLITQKIELSPEIELKAYTKDDEHEGVYAGLAAFEFSLFLKYFFTRQSAIYTGFSAENKLGKTRTIAKDAGEETSENSVLLGAKTWF